MEPMQAGQISNSLQTGTIQAVARFLFVDYNWLRPLQILSSASVNVHCSIIVRGALVREMGALSSLELPLDAFQNSSEISVYHLVTYLLVAQPSAECSQVVFRNLHDLIRKFPSIRKAGYFNLSLELPSDTR